MTKNINYTYSKQYIKLANNAFNRNGCKRPKNFNDVYTFQDLHNEPNIGLRLDDLVLIDFDNITKVQANAVITEAQQHNCIIHIISNDEVNLKLQPEDKRKDPNKWGVHLFFSMKESNKLKTGNSIPLVFGLNADIKKGNKSFAVVKLSDFEGCRITKSLNYNEAKNLSFESLDQIPPIFYSIGKGNKNFLD